MYFLTLNNTRVSAKGISLTDYGYGAKCLSLILKKSMLKYYFFTLNNSVIYGQETTK